MRKGPEGAFGMIQEKPKTGLFCHVLDAGKEHVCILTQGGTCLSSDDSSNPAIVCRGDVKESRVDGTADALASVISLSLASRALRW